MSKGIAIQTILLLLIGVLVVGILIYFVYSTFRGAGLSKMECKNAMISWCTSCSMVENEAWDQEVGYNPKKEVSDCAYDYFDITITNKCKGMKDKCKMFIPID